MSSQVANVHSRYESGDLVYRNRAGTELLRVRSDGSGITYANQNATDPWVFDVNKNYGAAADGTTDDTGAVNAAVTAATAYATNSANPPFAIIRGAGIMACSTATTKGGATAGNAQIPLPVRAGTARKIILVFQGPGRAEALDHWQQTTGQRWGWTIKSTLTGLNTDGAWGAPSIIGGPAVSGSSATYGSATGVFNNVHVVFDNVAVQAPVDPTIIGFDCRAMAAMTVTSAAAVADGTPTQMSTVVTNGFTRSYSSGLLVPQNLNNDVVVVGSFSCEGFYTGMSVSEHTAANAVRSIYCHDGIYVQADGNGNHSASILNASVEASVQGIYTDGGANPPVGFFCGMLDTEGITTNHIADHNNALSGSVLWNDNDNTVGLSPTVDGAANLRITACRRAKGAVTAPAVSSSTVALQNPFWRDAVVNITGGTVTVIKVDGATTGLTSGTVIVPSGKTVAITYSVAPTWVWTLL